MTSNFGNFLLIVKLRGALLEQKLSTLPAVSPTKAFSFVTILKATLPGERQNTQFTNFLCKASVLHGQLVSTFAFLSGKHSSVQSA